MNVVEPGIRGANWKGDVEAAMGIILGDGTAAGVRHTCGPARLHIEIRIGSIIAV